MAKALRYFHKTSIVVWLVMMPVSEFTGLASSTRFISQISLYSLVLSHFAGLGAARVEKKQDDS